MADLVTLNVQTEPSGTVVVAAIGELDVSNAEQLSAALAQLDTTPRVVVDLTRCTFFDSSCLSVLTRYAVRFAERGSDFRVRVDEQGRRVIELTSLAELLGIDRADP
jgi:anti-anti-sigma factor